MIALTTRTGQTIRVAEDKVEFWEARGYLRADQPATPKPAKAPAKKAAPRKRAAAKDK